MTLISTWADSPPTSHTEINSGTSNGKKATSKTLSLDFMSWQQQGTIKSAGNKSHLIVTNKVVCAGGSIGYKTASYRQFIDGCFFYGSGNVGSNKSVITYNQSDISVSGIKASIGVGKFVSSAGAEIGFKIPLMYVGQSLSKPSGASVHEPPALMAMGSLYSRWPFKQWFLQTEFSKIVGNDFTMFSLGAGYDF